jgi:outer membrane beta-barrel protein
MLIFIFISGLFYFGGVQAQDLKAVETQENVRPKRFTKDGRVELNLPDLGFIMNQAFVNTYLIHGGLNYYTSETFGIGIEGTYAINQDRPERECLETFYNDPLNRISTECGAFGGEAEVDPQGRTSNYGPAYMPIRELNYLFAVNAIWTPIYGKQLLWLSQTNYFDLFFTGGLGLAMSTYYPKRTTLENGKTSRAVYTRDGVLEGGASPAETDSYGKEGRPTPESQTNPYLNIGFGQKYHFAKMFSVRFEIRNMTLLGTEDGFENLTALWGGLGMRF